MSHYEEISLDVKLAKEENQYVRKKEFPLTTLKNFGMRHFLPIGTIFSINLGIFVPRPAVYLSERIPTVQVCVMVLCFTIGLRLRFHEAKSAIKSYKEVLVGLILVLFVCPVFGTNILNHIQHFGPPIGSAGLQMSKNDSNSSSQDMYMSILGPEEFRLALQIYIMCPSSIAATLIMVTAANGNRGLGILISILGSILSIFTIPPMLVWLIPSFQRIHINVGKVLLTIAVRMLLPMVIGRSLSFLPPVKKVVTKFDNTIKYTGISFLIAIFLVKVSETSWSGNLEKVSIVNILCVVALGISLTTFNLIVIYVVLTVLPWFSKKSAVTLSILGSNPVMVMAVTIVDLLPGNAGDKGLLTMPAIFVSLAMLLVLNCFVTFAKVQEDDSDEIKSNLQCVENGEIKDVEESNTNSKINEVAVFTIYTDEIPVKQQKL